MTHFTGSPLDRVDHIRSDVAAYEALRSDWRGRLLAFDGLDPQMSAEGGLVWHSMADEAGVVAERRIKSIER